MLRQPTAHIRRCGVTFDHGKRRRRWAPPFAYPRQGSEPYFVVLVPVGAAPVVVGGGAPPGAAAGQRLLLRSTSGYQLSGSITTLFTFFGPAISAV
jgi:hypothetical protein